MCVCLSLSLFLVLKIWYHSPAGIETWQICPWGEGMAKQLRCIASVAGCSRTDPSIWDGLVRLYPKIVSQLIQKAGHVVSYSRMPKTKALVDLGTPRSGFVFSLQIQNVIVCVPCFDHFGSSVWQSCLPRVHPCPRYGRSCEVLPAAGHLSDPTFQPTTAHVGGRPSNMTRLADRKCNLWCSFSLEVKVSFLSGNISPVSLSFSVCWTCGIQSLPVQCIGEGACFP